jgi:hypothetical protein
LFYDGAVSILGTVNARVAAVSLPIAQRTVLRLLAGAVGRVGIGRLSGKGEPVPSAESRAKK